MYDVFISYRRDGGYEMARLLYEHLKNLGLNPFFDLEELRSGPFNIKLYNVIEESENFVLVLPPNGLDRCVAQDDWLRLEVMHALLKEKTIIPVMMQGFEWPTPMPVGMEKLPNYNGVHMSREYFTASIEKLLSMLNGTRNGVKRPSSADSRTENTYFFYADSKERRRLEIQRNLMKSFDEATYRKVTDEFSQLRILDLGSNNGDFIMDRMASSDKTEKLVGLEFDPDAVAEGNRKYGQPGKIGFFQCNVEDEDLAEQLEAIMEQMEIADFNIINISMLLLHLKSPYRLLRTVRKYLASGGRVIIKDIDDGFNLTYPDEGGDFARIVDICHQNETSGYRHSGRQVYTLLRRSGYKDIVLEKLGISTVGMDYEKRSALFDTYFSFIMEDLRIMTERYPQDKRISQDYAWYKRSYEDLEEKFQDEALFFTLGFILFTARR